ALVTLAVLAVPARADFIFMKDGYVLQGRVLREGTNEFDPGSRMFNWMPKGFFMLDDGPRRVYFSPSQVSIVEKMPAPVEERIFRRGPEVWHLSAFARPKLPLVEVSAKTTPWDLKTWTREFHFRSSRQASNTVGCKQALAEMTPYYFRVATTTK